jgi:hypothetical protein
LSLTKSTIIEAILVSRMIDSAACIFSQAVDLRFYQNGLFHKKSYRFLKKSYFSRSGCLLQRCSFSEGSLS